jgi:hypothetical protein
LSRNTKEYSEVGGVNVVRDEKRSNDNDIS